MKAKWTIVLILALGSLASAQTTMTVDNFGNTSGSPSWNFAFPTYDPNTGLKDGGYIYLNPICYGAAPIYQQCPNHAIWAASGPLATNAYNLNLPEGSFTYFAPDNSFNFDRCTVVTSVDGTRQGCQWTDMTTTATVNGYIITFNSVFDGGKGSDTQPEQHGTGRFSRNIFGPGMAGLP